MSKQYKGLSSFVERIAQRPEGFFQFIIKEQPVNRALNSHLLTKCYNTATTLLYLLTLNKTALDKADVICHDKLYGTSISQEEKIKRFTALKKDVEKNDNSICLYYILMNVAEMDCPVNKNKKGNYLETLLNNFQSTKTFPGHVFLLEKVPYINNNGERSSKYFLYQSYINKYTLKDYLEKNGKTFEVSKEKILSYIEGMRQLMIEPKWTKETSTFWKEFTHVNSSDFNECNFHRIKPCYLKFKMKDVRLILNNYLKYLNNKLDELNKKIQSENCEYYSLEFNYEKNQYNGKVDKEKPLTIKELKEYIQGILDEIVSLNTIINNSKRKQTINEKFKKNSKLNNSPFTRMGRARSIIV